jgi:hypothetical protein
MATRAQVKAKRRGGDGGGGGAPPAAGAAGAGAGETADARFLHEHHIVHERPHVAPDDETVTKRRADNMMELILRRQIECCKDMMEPEWVAKLKETKVAYMNLTDAMIKGANRHLTTLTPQEQDDLFRPPGVAVYVPMAAPKDNA